MRVPVLFATAIATPLMLCASLLLPSYASIYGACYLVYMPQNDAAHPLIDKYLDVFTIFDTYLALVDFWSTTPDLGFVDHTLPIVVLPLVGCTLALYLTYRITRWLINIFQLSASI